MKDSLFNLSALISARISVAWGLSVLVAGAFSGPLVPGEPMRLDQTQGRFDFLRVDAVRHRLLLAHTGNKSLDVIDLDSGHLIKSVATGAAQDSAIDSKHNRYFVAVSSPPQMAIVDAEKLEVTGEVKLPQAADLMVFNEANGRAYVCNDEGPQLWIIDPAAKKILSTVEFTGKGMEGLCFEPSHARLFQALKDANAIEVLDVAANKVSETWTTAPATGPHGIELVPDSNLLLVAGGNGKLVLMECSKGKVVASADIAPRVDEISYDPQLHTVYCASGQGKISVVGLDGEKLVSMGDVPGAAGCHSIVVDPRTHKVWIAYAKGQESFIQSFTPEKKL
jgi:hypothetical protein